MAFDRSKLSPAPWECVRRRVPIGETGDLEEVACVFSGDEGLFEVWNPEESQVADLEFAALARNAEDVMMRREWHSVHWSDGWGVDASGDGAVDYDDWHESPFAAWLDGHRWDHPFTALVEADRWYRENVDQPPQARSGDNARSD